LIARLRQAASEQALRSLVALFRSVIAGQPARTAREQRVARRQLVACADRGIRRSVELGLRRSVGLLELVEGSAAAKTRSMAANCAGLSCWIDASPAVLAVGTEAAADAAPIAAGAIAHVTTTCSRTRAFVSSRDTRR
jgi:hypothetical protein